MFLNFYLSSYFLVFLSVSPPWSFNSECLRISRWLVALSQRVAFLSGGYLEWGKC